MKLIDVLSEKRVEELFCLSSIQILVSAFQSLSFNQLKYDYLSIIRESYFYEEFIKFTQKSFLIKTPPIKYSKSTNCCSIIFRLYLNPKILNNLFLFGHTHSFSLSSCGLRFLSSDLDSPPMSESSMQHHFLHPFKIFSEFSV